MLVVEVAAEWMPRTDRVDDRRSRELEQKRFMSDPRLAGMAAESREQKKGDWGY